MEEWCSRSHIGETEKYKELGPIFYHFSNKILGEIKIKHDLHISYAATPWYHPLFITLLLLLPHKQSQQIFPALTWHYG